MTDNLTPNGNVGHISAVDEDLTGRDRLVSSVVFNWAAYFVFIVAGFIMPRMIDDRLGRETLGIWDFAWSLISSFKLVQLGVGSSINRYIAKHRAAKDTYGINLIINSSCFLLGAAGLIILILTIVFTLILPDIFAKKLGENIQQAQWVILFIGIGASIQTALGSFDGLLTGFHRWGIYNFIKSGSYLLTVIFMIIALFRGGGLRSLAIVTFIGQVLEGIVRVIFAYRICEGLQIRPKFIKLGTIRKLFVFGGKTLIPSVSNLFLNQMASIIIIAYLNPAALALYARPRSLVLHINTLVRKMSTTLTPTVSSLQSINNFKEIRELLISSVRYSLYIVLPVVLVLVVFGDAVIQFWMGSDYANRLLITVLSLGFMTMMAQTPVLNILSGLNSHGRSGIARLISSIFSVILMFFMLGYLKWGVVGVACAITLPLTIMNLFYLPFLVCRKVGLEVKKYFLSVTVRPLIHVFPFAVCLITARFIFSTELFKGFLWGGATGGLTLVVLYWMYVLPARLRVKVLTALKQLF